MEQYIASLKAALENVPEGISPFDRRQLKAILDRALVKQLRAQLRGAAASGQSNDVTVSR